MIQIYNKLNQKKKSLSESINLIPMINLIFLLLIFFLLTGVIQRKDDPAIIIPESIHGSKKSKSYKTIEINKYAEVKINQNFFKLDEIKNLNLDKNQTTILNIDRDIKVADYNKILKILKFKGLEKISINVKKK